MLWDSRRASAASLLKKTSLNIAEDFLLNYGPISLITLVSKTPPFYRISFILAYWASHLYCVSTEATMHSYIQALHLLLLYIASYLIRPLQLDHIWTSTCPLALGWHSPLNQNGWFLQGSDNTYFQTVPQLIKKT